jgi:hypothetical protein
MDMSSVATIPVNKIPAPGWKGGFSTSNPAFAYPNPNLSSLPMTGNMDNIRKLRRQIHVLWPEFTWLTVQGDANSRCYQMFAPDISRGGYDDKGQFWSIICPQQGSYSPTLGSLNIEVSVTSQRGWMDETVQDRNADLLAADMTVAGKVWFAPSAKDSFLYNLLKLLVESHNLPFPLDKAHAIEITLVNVDNPNTPILPVRSGEAAGIQVPGFATHWTDGAWGVANVAVRIGSIYRYNNPIVDDFNAMVMDLVNLGSGNVLQEGNILTWNVWFDAPSLVDQCDWANHAKKWRESLDTGHGSPDGPGTLPRYFDGTYFKPIDAVIEAEWDKICAWVKKHFDITLPDSAPVGLAKTPKQ